jgi:NAD(P)-dependent dehydrogenase (short-subunit alcohol dehydrogenase family)
MVHAVTARFGKIDILVNNAGGGSGQGECNFLRRDPDLIRSMIDSNLTGVLFCCRAVCGLMAERNSGAIINIASIAGLVGRDREMYHASHKMEQPVEYAAAKSGVLGLTRDLAAFMAPYGVRVNAISPGGFNKGDISSEFEQAYSNLTPMRRMGRMQSDLPGAVLYLASPASAYVTGQNLVVDGGFSVCK